MRPRFIRGLIVLIALSLSAAIANAQPQPTTNPTTPNRPGGFGGGGGAGRGEMIMQRIQAAMADLDLTADQKQKVQTILDKAGEDIRQMLPELQNLQPQERQEKMRAFVTDLRDKVSAVLNDDQKAKMRDKMLQLRGGQQNGPGNNANGGANSNRPGATDPRQGAADQASPNQRMAAIVQRLQESLATLDLTPDQKKQVNSIVEDGKKQLAEFREKMRSGSMQPDEMRSEGQKILAAMRDQLAGVLSKDQQEKLRDAIQSRYDHENSTTPATQPTMKMDTSAPGTMHLTSNEPSHGPTARTPTAAPPELGPKIGQPAPDFSVQELTGRTIQLANFTNRPLVIEFGSYSSPSFRQRAAKMEDLSRQYGNRAAFLVVYTKEAHPTGGWEVDRNKDDNIHVAAHTDLTARKTAAKEAKQTLKINIPIAIDTMDDQMLTAFGASENSAFIIGRDGKIAARETWSDTFRLKTALDAALAPKPTTLPVN